MAMRGGYVVLEVNESSSSGAQYQLRRGGDGVLYCECMGWKMNRPRSGDPKTCKHTRDYVARYPGVAYGPPGMFAAHAVAQSTEAPSRSASRRVARAPSAPVPTTAAPKNWRDVLLDEAAAAAARGAVTPPSDLEIYRAEIGARFANLDF